MNNFDNNNFDNSLDNNKDVIFATSSYKEKFYFSPKADTLPENIKNEIKEIGILLVNKVGGVLSLGFYNDDAEMFIDYDYDDVFCDDIGAKLEIEKLKREKREFFENLSNWYKIFILKNIK